MEFGFNGLFGDVELGAGGLGFELPRYGSLQNSEDKARQAPKFAGHNSFSQKDGHGVAVGDAARLAISGAVYGHKKAACGRQET